jgi:hypothetical protein
MRTFDGWILGVALMTVGHSLVLAETVNVECSCITSVSKLATPLKYVISTSVASKDQATAATLAYACYQQRPNPHTCLEGDDRESSLQYFKGKLQE